MAWLGRKGQTENSAVSAVGAYARGHGFNA